MPSGWYNFLHENNSLFGGAVGAMLTATLLALKQSFGRPRLDLDFKSNEAYLPESTHAEGDIPTVTRKYLRVSLKATGLFGRNLGGSSGAKNCRIYLTSIQPVTTGTVGKDHIYDARPISWPPNNEFNPRDIPRGVTMFANVVTIKKGNLGWTFQIPSTYGLEQELLTHPGTMRIGVTATADNANPVSIYVRASIKADKSGFEAYQEE